MSGKKLEQSKHDLLRRHFGACIPRIHAANVLHMSQLLVNCEGGLQDCGITEGVLELSLYLAAACHDYDHPGLNNDFLIKSQHPLAILHNDRSPLEQHHCSAGYRLLYQHLSAAIGKAEVCLSNLTGLSNCNGCSGKQRHLHAHDTDKPARMSVLTVKRMLACKQTDWGYGPVLHSR